MLHAGPVRSLAFGCLVLVSVAIVGCGAGKTVADPTPPEPTVITPPPASPPAPPPAEAEKKPDPPRKLAPVKVTVPAGSPLGEGDMVLGGVKLGTTLAEARQLLGELKRSAGEWGDYWQYDGGEESLALYETDGVIVEVDTFDVPTPRGLRIGDPQEKVEELYGKPDRVSEKWGEWVYEGPRPFKLVVGIPGDGVAWVRIINFGLTLPKPEPGREATAVTTVPPLGPEDFAIGAFTPCWTAEQAEQQGLEPYLPDDTRASSGYASKDRFVQLLNDPGGLNTFTMPRLLRTIITGGAYQTARDVRVGDPESRVEALYGPAERHEEGWDTFLAYTSGDLTLKFTANLNGRITAIELSCFQKQ